MMADELAHELQIRNLLARLAHATDLASDDELDSKYLACFTEDAIWEAPPSISRNGHAEIRASAMDRRRTKAGGPGSHTLHVVTPGYIQIQGNDASAISSYVYYGLAEGPAKILSLGLYNDTFRYVDGAWRVSRRTLVKP
jgi:3-phenylpropionate/cinnamic acid dioxygenase small subunit